MPINSLQPRLSQVGVIRLGRQLMSKNNKPYPAKLETFRFTSPSRPLIEELARLFGGEVAPWKNTTGPEFEVITAAKEIAVFVPPQRIDPNFEHWGNGYRDRLCDGDTERIRQIPCMCLAQWGDRFSENAPLGQACKPTTRMSLLIADLQGLGTWKCESHGWNAASELPMLAESIANAPEPIPARLELQARQKKGFDPNAATGDQVKSKSFMVPVLHFDLFTPKQAFRGEIGSAVRESLEGAERRPALAARPAAVTAARAATARTTTTAVADPDDAPVDWLAEIAAAGSVTAVNKLRVQMQRAGVADKAIVDAWVARSAELGATSAVAKKTPEPTPVADDEIVDAVIVDDRPAMSGAQAWQAALEFAHTKGWNAPALAQRFTAKYGVDHRDDTKTSDAMFVEFLGLLKSGAIA